jgi:hypothetical protein
MPGNLDGIWTEALTPVIDSLTPREREIVGSVTSQECMQRKLSAAFRHYRGKRSVRLLRRLQPIIQWLAGFNDCVKIFLQVAPPELVLAWGALSFLFEVIGSTEMVYGSLTRSLGHCALQPSTGEGRRDFRRYSKCVATF